MVKTLPINLKESLMRFFLKHILWTYLCLTLNARCSFDNEKYYGSIQSDQKITDTTESNHQRGISFEREVTFGENSNVLFGAISKAVSDEAGRVYMSDNQKKQIHIFEPDGTYLKSLGKEGRGPGDFMFLGEISIHSERLYVVDTMQFRVNVFSTKTLELIDNYNLNPTNQKEFPELSGLQLNFSKVINDSTFLVNFSELRNLRNVEQVRYRSYYLVNNKSEIISDKVLKLPDTPFITSEVQGRRIAANFTFLGKPLIDIAPSGAIFSAWSEEFLIERYNVEGELKETIHFPFERNSLSKKNIIDNLSDPSRAEFFKNIDLPDNWPAIDDFIIDDVNRLWVSTITDLDEYYEWWVIDYEGNLIGKFKWPGNRHRYSREIQHVNNGKMFALEIDEQTGLQQIVRYNIEFEEI